MNRILFRYRTQMSSFTAFVLFLFCFLFDSSARANQDPYQFGFEIGLNELKGKTLYRIGDSSLSMNPMSELDFPLDLRMLSGVMQLQIEDVLTLSASYALKLRNKTGTMKDSDWSYWYSYDFSWASPTSLDIYSESDAEVDARIFEFKSSLMPVVHQADTWSLRFGTGFGYKRQKFNYDVYDVDQWYPSYAEYADDISNEPFSRISFDDRLRLAGHDYVSGKVVAYDVTYDIFYLELSGVIDFSNSLTVGMNLGFAPYVKAEDYDNHILRSKICKGSCDGYAHMRELFVSYNFAKNFRLTLEYDAMKIDTSGAQRQYFSTGTVLSVDQDIISKQYMFSVRLGYFY